MGESINRLLLRLFRFANALYVRKILLYLSVSEASSSEANVAGSTRWVCPFLVRWSIDLYLSVKNQVSIESGGSQLCLLS